MFSTMNHPANNSTAKYHWSFGHAHRFKDSHTYGSASLYDTSKKWKSARSASIGCGSRSRYLQGKKDTVDPCAYNLSSSFDANKSKNTKKGYSFTLNRDELSFSNYLNVNEKTPSPFAYGLHQGQKERSAYSMRYRTKRPEDVLIQRKSDEPGRGHYKTIDQVGSSSYTNSKILNPTHGIISRYNRPGSSKKTPGPADYTINSVKYNGDYILSNMKGSGRRSIMNEKRVLQLNGNQFTPGPGTYRLPSDFGYCDTKVRPSTARR